MSPLSLPPPPLRLVLAVALLTAPAAAVLMLLAALGHLGVLPAVLGTLGVLMAAVLVLRLYRTDVAAIGDYVRRLSDAEPGQAVPVPEGRSAAARAVNAALARLHRTWRRRYERLSAELAANERILEALVDPLVVVDQDRRVIRANRAARVLFGERMPDRDLAASLRNPLVLGAVDAAIGGASSRTLDLSMPVPVERTFQVRVQPFRQDQPDGEKAGCTVLVTLHDVTAMKRSERMRADFVANASHELRTPLSTLLGFVETLRGPARGDQEAHDHFLAIMHEQASRMSRLVGDLLSLSRIELDEHMAPTGRLDLPALLGSVVATLELKAKARRIRIRLEAPSVVPPVTGDADQLSQVFQNLIDNALKYGREDSEVTVAVGTSDGVLAGSALANVPRLTPAAPASGPDMVSVAVIDRGEGIARTHLPRLTERFYRADAARSKALGGTGLGLAIVKHIVNRHRGRLTIESEVGQGSTFTVYLPAAVDRGVDEGDVPRRLDGAA